MSPLDVTQASSSAALERAQAAASQAKDNARFAALAAYLLIFAAFMAFVLFQHPASFVVVSGSLGLAALAHRRANILERRLWWHQARNGLVTALSEQRRVIDLRDSASDRVDK